jgi:MFS superfamily sulfate permease-like transporter
MLVRLISDSILVGFKAGAGLTIAMTQMPSLLGVAGGGHTAGCRVSAACLHRKCFRGTHVRGEAWV